MKEWLKAESSDDVAEFYNRKYQLAGMEAFQGGKYEYFFKHFLELFGKPRPTDRLLDCGCGHGEFFENVLSHFKFSSPHMTGIDVSEEAIKLAHRRFRNYEYNFKFEKHSMENLFSISAPIDLKGYDVVTSWGSIEHTFEPLTALEGMLNVVKPGGIVMITVPLEFEGCLKYIEDETFNKNNERFMDYMEWIAYFSKVKKPIMTQKLMPEAEDVLLVFRK